MKPFTKIFFIVLICFFIFYGKADAQQQMASRPNIIFIIVDDQGYGDVGVFYQNKRAAMHDLSKPFEISPNLDKLAFEGAIFTQHYCAAPVCAPSRASLMLGVSQGRSNIRDEQFDKALENNYNIASTLHMLGYSTAAIGKWGLQGNDKWDVDGYKWPSHPLKRGFDYFFGYMRHSDGHEHYPKNGLYRLYWAEKEKEVWQNYTNMTPLLDKCYTADLWIAVAKKYIEDHVKGADKDKPFFLYLAFDTPHAVLELPTEAYPAGKGLNGGMKWLGEAGHFISTAEGNPDSYIYPEYKDAKYKDDAGSKVDWPETYKRYATANRRIDDGVGDIKQLLKDLKIDSNTIVVYTSDNGPSLESYLPGKYVPNHPTFFSSYGPFDGTKRDNWEGGVRMPTIAWWPGHIAPGKVISAPSISYDWAPTFLDLAGTAPPVRMDGVSLLPSLTGTGKQKKGLIYIEYYSHGTTPDFKEFEPDHRGRIRNQMQLLRLGDYVGVRYDIKTPGDNFEIYNVKTDPKERRNIAAGKIKNASSNLLNIVTDTGINKMRVSTLEDYMKARVLQVRRSNKSAPRPYDTTLIPSVTVANVVQGLDWKIYEGDFQWIPNIDNMEASFAGEAMTTNPRIVKKEKSAILFFSGYIRVPADGKYTFYMSSDTKAYFQIHDIEVIDEDYGYSGDLTRSETLYLKAGFHPIGLYYYCTAANGEPFLRLAWSGRSMKKQTLKPFLFHSQPD